jgi:hypothetical protein
MALITPDLSGIVDGAVADAVDITNPLNTIINDYNGNIDNSNIAAAANISFSKLDTSAFTASTPTIQKSDGTTSLTASINTSRYIQIGKLVIWVLHLTGIGDPSGIAIYASCPVTPRTSTDEVAVGNGIGGTTTGAGTYYGIGAVITAGATKVRITNVTLGSWSGANNLATLVMMYEAA